MSLDPSKFKNVKNKESEKMATVIIVCLILAQFTFGLSIIYMFYYIFKNATKTVKANYQIDSTNDDTEQNENLYEELEDTTTKDYYRYDTNDISQEEIHEHREDFWNVNSPIKYK